MLVKDLEVEDVARIDIDKDIIDALCIMFMNKQRCLPVFNKSVYAGIICIADYVKVLQQLRDRKPESISVNEIMDKFYVTASPNTPVEHVIDRLCEKSIYGVPILSGHEFVGIVRREDVLKHFLNLFKGKFKVMDVMSYNVSTNSIHDTLERLGKKILTGLERRIVIMNYHHVEGTVTIQDLANVLLTDHVDLSTMSVKDILIPNPASVRKSDDAMKAAKLMLEWNVGGIPVIDEDLEGIVRDKDVIQRIHIIR
jgi:CBS domain-containing protein